ncbi:MAG: cation:proton antiporter [Planctomycetaceae bacterium]|nr:cation:proton antiporter [Planctomycetaceae bacterium]
MEGLLRSLVLVFLVAGGVLQLFHRLRLPPIIGLLVAGVLIGPHGFGVLRDRTQIEQLAEFGVLLLMFTIGLDFNRERLRELLYAGGMGSVQMLFCIVVTALLSAAWFDRWAEAVFLGFLVSHTSSTLMLKLFLDRGELSTPPVRLGLGISITQDLSAVLMLIAIPVMAGENFVAADFGLMLLRLLGVFVVAVALARWIIPYWMEWVVRTRSRELFLVFLIVVCLGTAWVTLAAGLSIGLGAFLAGLAIAESAYSHHTLSEVAPFRDLLISVFFMSVGMLLDFHVLAENAWLAGFLLLAVLPIKFISGFAPVLIWGYPLRVATIVGNAMAQIGEFSFVVGHVGHKAGLIDDGLYAVFLAVAVASMIVNPLLIAGSPRATAALAKIPWLRRLDRRANESDELPPMENHVLIAGYGLNGRNLASSLKTFGLPYAVLEMNPDTVQAARRRGEPIFFGDCSRVEVLRKLHIGTARGLVLAISDPQATRQAVQIARHENPRLHIVVRTRYLAEIDPLRELGATEVIAEEFETSLEVLALTLRLFEIAGPSIERIVEHFRSNAYRALRSELPSPERPPLLETLLQEIDIETHRLEVGARAIGKTLRELNLRARTGATLLAVRRDSALTAVPPADFQFQEHDVLVLAGNSHQIASALDLIAGADDASD